VVEAIQAFRRQQIRLDGICASRFGEIYRERLANYTQGDCHSAVCGKTVRRYLWNGT